MTDFRTKLTAGGQDAVSLVLGLGLIVSPWVFGFEGIAAAFWNALIVGAAIVILSLLALRDFHNWEEWLDAAVGAWLVISPWILGIVSDRALPGADAATWLFVAIGLLIVAMASWSLIRHDRGAHA